MPQPFEFDGRFYTFRREPGQVTIVRDDGLIAWDTYAVWRYQDGPTFHAYSPAFANIAECKQALRGERPDTYHHHLVFAASAEDAIALRMSETLADAAKAKEEAA
jgi:hypothetical protein